MPYNGIPADRRCAPPPGLGSAAKQAQLSPPAAGQGLIEYVLLLALAAIVVVAGATLLGGSLSETYDKIVASLGGTPQPTTVTGAPTPTAAGPAEVTVRVLDDAGAGLAGVPVSAFLNDQGHYTGLTQTSDTSGQTRFSLPAGTYLFRGDYLGKAYWSPPLETPAGSSVTIRANICQDISLTGVTFPDRGNPVDGMLVIVRVNNNSGREMRITQVTIDWDYLRSLPEEPGGKIRVYGAYFCPGNDSNCNVANRTRWFNNLTPGWGTDMNITTSPTTANRNPQVLPTNGGYISFDFDTRNGMDRRSLAAAPWYVAASDFGFQVSIDGCPNPVTKSAISR